MKIIIALLLTILSNFALGNQDLITESVKANDLEALESILVNTAANDALKNSWEDIIEEKIGDAIKNKNKEALLLLLDAIEVTDANKDAWQWVFQRQVYAACYKFPEIVLPLLQFGEENGLKLLLSSYDLGYLIQKCDEETAIFAITHYPDEVPDAGDQLVNNYQTYIPETRSHIFESGITRLKELSINLLTILLDNGCKKILTSLLALDNGLKILEQVMHKDPALVLKHSEFGEFFKETIKQGHFDILEFLSQYDIKLETITKTNSDIEIKDIIGAAVASTEHRNNDMLNHVLNALNARDNPAALAAAARLNNGTLFNNLLNKGYAADPNLASDINLNGLVSAIQSGNKQAISYYLEQSVDPNPAFDELGRVDFLCYPNPKHSIQIDQKLEILELLITHGLKIDGLDIAKCAEAGSLEMIKYFKDKGYDTKHPAIFVSACGSGKIELIDFLLEDGANINDPNALVSGVRADNRQGGDIKVVQYLIEKGANPNNLMALNEALRTYNSAWTRALNSARGTYYPELNVAKYLLEKGAKAEPRCIISAGLTGSPTALRWALEQTHTTITAELEGIINSPADNIIRYTTLHLVPKDSTLIGITNEGYHFADGIGGVASELMEQNSDVFIVPLNEQLASDDAIMIRFSGFINPGAGDSYPKNMPEFSIKDINQEKMMDYERLYQRVISFAKKYDIPYLGICLGSQHLNLNSEGFLQPVKGHGESITVHFEKGSIPHFMTLLPHERAKALQKCQLDDISAENAVVAHGFAGVTNKLGKNVKLGAISGKNNTVPESVYHGHNQIGVQFHPERAYFREPGGKINRQKVLLDSFFQTSLNHHASRSYALETGFHYIDARNSIHQANQKLVNHLESCSKNPEYSRKDHFWGHNLGSSKIPANTSTKDASVNVLTGLTPNDVALARDGDDLILIIKSSGEMLSIESHFAPDGDHRVKSIDFADGSRLILNEDNDIKDGFTSHIENQSSFHRNATALDSKSFTKN